jgi:2-hydroxychromene-2-carboxylate isomerase
MIKRKHKYQVVVDMVRAGVPRKVIAAQLGTPLYTVHSCIRYAREHGVSVKFDPEYARFGYLPLRIKKWLKTQVPEGATMEDVIVAILTDAHEAEMEKDK